jgi:hypothetical protein
MIHMADQKNVCPDCGARLQFASGCRFCPECGHGKCGRVAQTAAAFVVLLVCLAVVVSI